VHDQGVCRGTDLEQKSSDPDAIVQAYAPKQIVMQFLHGVSKGRIANAFDDSFNDNTPGAQKTMKAVLDRFSGALEPVSGDQMVFIYIPGTGTTFASNGKAKLTIVGRFLHACCFRCGPDRSHPMRI
jgi:Chalcone isomerase-like